MADFNWPIIGHQSIKKYLQTVIANNSAHHAYFFYGPAGLGKTLMADYFIKSLYCLALSGRPCRACLHCRQINNYSHPDVVYLDKDDDKKNITVEQIRQMRSQVQHAGFLNSYKVVLIFSAKNLSLGAANAMLKILEEPPGKTIFIFISDSLAGIPQTIISRSQIIKFIPLPAAEIEQYLLVQKINQQEAYLLSRMAAGIPGKIIPLIGHPRLLAEYKKKFQEILSEMNGRLAQRFSLAENLTAQGNSLTAKSQAKKFLEQLTSLLRDVLLVKNSSFGQLSHPELKQQLTAFAARYTLSHLLDLCYQLYRADRLIGRNVNLRLIMENIMLSFSVPGP